MKFTLARELLLKPLQLASSVAGKRSNRPVLSHVLFRFEATRLQIIGSDLEVELVGILPLEWQIDLTDITLPAKKLLDICRSLPEQALIEFVIDESRVTVKSGRSRFVLSSLPAEDFPNTESAPGEVEFSVSQQVIKRLIEQTAFSMAQQDVRYYLNGVLIQLASSGVVMVATDGHRLAYAQAEAQVPIEGTRQVILPRKGVVELSRLLNDDLAMVTVVLDSKHLSVTGNDFIFTSKLIEGRFPDYQKVFPEAAPIVIDIDKIALKQAVSRAAILSNEKNKGVRLQLDTNILRLSANNPEQEEAEEELEISYQGEPIQIGFNASYLLDVLSVVQNSSVQLSLSGSQSSALFEDSLPGIVYRYIVMPMQI